MPKANKSNPVEVNKTQLVAEAMDALGDPGPKEIIAYVQEHHHIELPYSQAATYKSIIKKRRAKQDGSPSGPVDLKDVAAVKALYDRLGPEKLNDILKLFQ